MHTQYHQYQPKDLKEALERNKGGSDTIRFMLKRTKI